MTVEQKKELVRFRLNKAQETISEVQFQIEHKKWNTAGNRMYYSCYYAVSALLVWNNLNAKSHSGVRQMFAMHFIRPRIVSESLGDAYTDIFELRQTGDYDDFVVFDAEKVQALLPLAQALITQIIQLLEPDINAINQ